ncbi:MAG: type II toxin-antitoxin system Phd/YefM family antitoxin [Anaerolineales bacterium]
MDKTWQIQDAKNKLSEVIARALKQGPQLITRHGEKTAVVVSYAEYEKLRKSQGKLSDFFGTSPLADADLDLTRDRSLPRAGLDL